jgi:hypothetical protein
VTPCDPGTQDPAPINEVPPGDRRGGDGWRDTHRAARLKRPRHSIRLKASKLSAGKHTLTVQVRSRDGKAKRAKLRLRLAVA